MEADYVHAAIHNSCCACSTKWVNRFADRSFQASNFSNFQTAIKMLECQAYFCSCVVRCTGLLKLSTPDCKRSINKIDP